MGYLLGGAGALTIVRPLTACLELRFECGDTFLRFAGQLFGSGCAVTLAFQDRVRDNVLSVFGRDAIGLRLRRAARLVLLR